MNQENTNIEKAIQNMTESLSRLKASVSARPQSADIVNQIGDIQKVFSTLVNEIRELEPVEA